MGCNEIIEINSKDSLLEVAHEEGRIYIYGAGKIAKKVVEFLPADGKYQIEGVIVTEKKEATDKFMNLPLKPVTDKSIDKNKLVLIGTGKKYQKEIRKELEQNNFRKVAVVSETLEKELLDDKKSTSAIKQIDSEEILRCIKRVTPRTILKTLVVNICDHCNLNCRGCDHFSPIANKRFDDVNRIEKDLRQLRKILDESIEKIGVMGGEPLLHPELCEILKISRDIFPNTLIWLCTNGIGLLKQSEEFWECCRENKIVINVTKYPIAFDYEEAENLAREKGVEYCYYHGGQVEKTLGHYPLDISGRQDATDSFLHCFHANNTCNMLSNGKLYTCTVAPNIPIFCEKYGLENPLTEEDGIDIYSVANKRELFELLSHPMPICSYCNTRGRTFLHPWGQSERKIEEWT